MSILRSLTPDTLVQRNLLDRCYYVCNLRSWMGNPISHLLIPMGSSKIHANPFSTEVMMKIRCRFNGSPYSLGLIVIFPRTAEII